MDTLEKFAKGIYSSLDQLMEEVRRVAQCKQFDFTFDKITRKLVLQFGANEGFSFENEGVPNTLGFKGKKTTRMMDTFILDTNHTKLSIDTKVFFLMT